jgi:hypothetical protein
VLRLRFEQDMTQAEIGRVIGVSQMQVSRIIHHTLERMRAGTGVGGVLAPEPLARNLQFAKNRRRVDGRRALTSRLIAG